MAPCRHQGESPSAVRPSLTGGHPAISRAAPQPAILGPYARSQDDGSDGGAASAVLLCARGRVLRDGARARARGGAGSPHPLLSAARPGARPHADARVDQHGDDGRALPLRAGAHQAPRAVSPPRRSAVGELRRRHDSADRWLLDRLLADRHRRRRHARHLGRPALREPLADAARGAAARGCGARRGARDHGARRRGDPRHAARSRQAARVPRRRRGDQPRRPRAPRRPRLGGPHRLRLVLPLPPSLLAAAVLALVAALWWRSALTPVAALAVAAALAAYAALAARVVRTHRLPLDWTARHAIASVGWCLVTAAAGLVLCVLGGQGE